MENTIQPLQPKDINDILAAIPYLEYDRRLFDLIGLHIDTNDILGRGAYGVAYGGFYGYNVCLFSSPSQGVYNLELKANQKLIN